MNEEETAPEVEFDQERPVLKITWIENPSELTARGVVLINGQECNW